MKYKRRKIREDDILHVLWRRAMLKPGSKRWRGRHKHLLDYDIEINLKEYCFNFLYKCHWLKIPSIGTLFSLWWSQSAFSFHEKRTISKPHKQLSVCNIDFEPWSQLSCTPCPFYRVPAHRPLRRIYGLHLPEGLATSSILNNRMKGATL